MAHADTALCVQVLYSPAPREVQTAALALPPGSTVADALRASGLLERHGLALQSLHCGVWGKAQALDKPLRDGDRVELYRPLIVDPKEARRLRYKKQRRA